MKIALDDEKRYVQDLDRSIEPLLLSEKHQGQERAWFKRSQLPQGFSILLPAPVVQLNRSRSLSKPRKQQAGRSLLLLPRRRLSLSMFPCLSASQDILCAVNISA